MTWEILADIEVAPREYAKTEIFDERATARSARAVVNGLLRDGYRVFVKTPDRGIVEGIDFVNVPTNDMGYEVPVDGDFVPGSGWHEGNVS